jgi:acyl-CoA synthetase (AMP-forming)/AMP-acid ligase II
MQPDAAALIDAERTITYSKLANMVQRTAGHLKTLGVRQGDNVGLCLKDDWRHVVVMLAVIQLGAVAVPMDWRSRPTEKTRIANAFAFKLLVVLPESSFAAPCQTVAVDQVWDTAVAAAEQAAPVSVTWQAPAVVQASSGTTGLPKFTLATHLNLYLHVATFLEIVPQIHRHRCLLTLPLYFSAGRLLCLAHLVRGDTLIFYPSLFTAAEFAEVANRYQVTTGFIVPSVARQLFQLAESPYPLFPNLELLICGGAPLFTDEKREALLKLTPKFHEMYGAAAIGPLSALRPQDMIERSMSVGRPFSLVDLEAIDDDDQPVGPEIPGRLRCRGPGLTSPIFGPSDLTMSNEFRDGWYYPGEVAAIDQLGYVYLQGRTSEVLFRGGAKIFPAEVEGVLQSHEAVVEAAVVGSAPASQRQELIAYVVTKGNVTPGDLIAHCRTHLTAYKVPREIHIVPEMLRNSSGKPDKLALTEIAGVSVAPRAEN